MTRTRRPFRLPTSLLSCLTAALLTTQVLAAIPVVIDYTDGQTDANPYDTSTPNDPTGLSILSGTATQSGIITGTGQVIKLGAGTLILSGANDYTGTTTLNAGTLQVAAGGAISHSSANLFVASDDGDVATLLISGGSVSNNRGILGNDLNSFGTATMSGGTWTNNSNLYLGWSGTGVLNLSAGTVINQLGVIGLQFEGSGTANVSGGTWTNLAELYIGNSGSGVFNLSGGTVTDTSGYLGWDYGSSGTANVSGGTWTNNYDLVIGQSGTGVLNLSGGSVKNDFGYLGYNSGSGTVNVSGGDWTNYSGLLVGYDGTGVLNLSGGNVSTNAGYMGFLSVSSGIANVSGGTWTNNSDLFVGFEGTGVLNITDGSVSNDFGYLGNAAGSSGTANVSGGTWTNNSDLTVGDYGTGVLNLTDSGTVSVGNGTLYLANNAGSSGTLNIGTGGAAGKLEADSVLGGDGTAVVNFNHTGSLNFTASLDGNLSVNQFGPGTTTLSAQNTYTGTTSVLGGTLELSFGGVTTDILSANSSLSMGSGTLLFTGEGIQDLSSLNTVGGAGSIVLGQNQNVDLGALGTVASDSALNFNTAACGADGEDWGSSSIALNYPSSYTPLHSGFTVTDSTGFGLAALNDLGFIIRLTSTDLLPASGTDNDNSYLIDNNPGDSTTAGSSSLIVTASQATYSITVDTTAAPGVLTLAENALLSTSILNFGSAPGSSHAFEITGGPNSGITTNVSSGFIQINNYNAAPVTISTSILETRVTGLRVGGTGTTILTATSNYIGDTIVTSGVLEVATNGSINNDPSNTTVSKTIVGYQQGDHATLLISGGSVTSGSGFLGYSSGSSGTANMSDGSWINYIELYIGHSGTGMLNLTGGDISNTTDFLGYASGSSGTANVSGGTWSNYLGFEIGHSGTGVLNLSGGGITNFNFDSILGNNAGSSGTANVSGGYWRSPKLVIGNEGTGVINISGGDVGSNVVLGNLAGGSGTANVSGGIWRSNDFTIGSYGTGVVNLNGGGVSAENGPLYMATHAGSSGTLNIGTGGVMGTVSASSIIGGDGTAVVNFNHTDNTNFGAKLEGSMTVNFIGSGTTLLWGQSTYTGPTNLLGGTLGLGYFVFGSDHVLSTTTDLTLGSATLSILSGGSNTVHSLSTRADSAGSIIMGENPTLDLGALASVGTHSALNFNTSRGGADGATVGSSTVLLDGQTAGSAINSSFTVTDATGFGLATVNNLGQIIRLTTTDLLPATATDSGTDYLINNNAGGSSTPGSALLNVTENQTVRSITVDTTAGSGVLTLGSDVVISSDVWNFGGTLKNTFEITGGGSAGGITSATAGGTLQINNYRALPVVISAGIQNNGKNSVLFQGTGTTVLAGVNSYLGDTAITSGFVEVAKTGSINGSGTTTVGKQTGDNANLVILGNVLNLSGIIGDAAAANGTVNVTNSGSWGQKGDLTVGKSGTGVLNIDQGTVNSISALIGANAGSSGTVTVSNAGVWNVSGGLGLFIGPNGTGVLNISSGGGVNVRGGGVTVGAQGTLNIGTGGIAGSLDAPAVTGVSGAVVSYNYTGLGKFSFPTTPVLTGDLAVNKLGGGYLGFDQQNTYTGRTTVNGGVLSLNFDAIISDIISSQSALTLGGGSLALFNNSVSSASQTLNGLTTTAGTGSQIYLSSNNTLDLGALTSAGKASALNFYLYDGGADGATVGTGIVLLSGQTAGSVINPGFTVTDRGGFGLATVNDLNQIIRLTSTDLLPHSGADAGKDYRVDNSGGGSMGSTLEITASQTARSITVDTPQTHSLLLLRSGSVLSSDVWNFGGGYNNEINGNDSGAGIKTATAGGMLQVNNYKSNALVTISAPILDNGGSGLRVAGPNGITILNGTDTYKGETIINNGTLLINGDHTAATGEVIVQSSAELAGIGQIGSNIHVLNGGMLTPGTFDDFGNLIGTLTGTSATFDTNSIFHVIGSGDTIGTLHLTGGVTIASGALIYVETDSDLTLSKYTLMIADGGGLDGDTPFTLGSFFGKLPSNGDVIPGYHLVYTGNTLDLVSDVTAPAVAYWTGKVDNKWSSLTSGTTNWATDADGLTDTGALPDSPTDVTFSATGTGPVATNLDTNFTVNTLTVNSDTSISNDTDTTHTLTVNSTTAVNARLTLHTLVTLVSNGSLTIDTTGTLAGSGEVHMENDQSMFVNGSISVGDPSAISPQVLNLYANGPTGTGAIVMGLDSTIRISLNTGAGLGDNAYIGTAAGVLNLHGVLDATAGGTLVLENPNHMTAYAGGDQWRVFDFNSGEGNIIGHLALNDSGLGLATGYIGSFDQTTGIYTIADLRAEMTAQSSGLPMANAEGPAIISGSQTATNDINNHLFNLRSGGGEEGDDDEGGISASLDYGVVMGEGDGPEDPIARRVKRSRQWEVFTTVNYGNVKLNPISSQSGVQIDSWASSVGIERHLSRGLTLGFAVTFLQSTQTYTGGLGKLDLEGPNLSAYLAYARKGFWGSLLYSFGAYDLGSQRNPGLGLPSAAGATNAYTNAIQYNTGWNFRFLQDRSLVTGPFIGIDYLHGSVDAYSETGGGAGALRYARQTFESLVTRVGWSTSKKFHTDWADITPQFRLSYERQNVKNNGTSVSLINAPFTAAGGNQTPGQDYMVLGTGVNFQFTPDFSMLLGYQVQLFRNSMEAHFGSVRFGYKF